MTFIQLTLDKERKIAFVNLNDPSKLNRLSESLRKELLSTIQLLNSKYPHECKVVVLSGNGKCFSAGADLQRDSNNNIDVNEDEEAEDKNVKKKNKNGIKRGNGSFAAVATDIQRMRNNGRVWENILNEIQQSPLIFIAVVHGHCIGGGALLALVCDIRIGLPSLQVKIPEVPLGIPLTWRGNPILIRELGYARARDLVMTGRSIDAKTALEYGFITRLHAIDAHAVEENDSRKLIEAASREVIDEILSGPSGVLSMTKDHFRAMSSSLMAYGWADGDILSWITSHPDTTAHSLQYWNKLLEDKKNKNKKKNKNDLVSKL